MAGRERDLTKPDPRMPEWKARLAVALANRGTTLRHVAEVAVERGYKLSRSTASEVWSGKMPPNDRFIGAVSLILGIHPADLGFDRTPATEWGFRAYEWDHPEDRRVPHPSELLRTG